MLLLYIEHAHLEGIQKVIQKGIENGIQKGIQNKLKQQNGTSIQKYACFYLRHYFVQFVSLTIWHRKASNPMTEIAVKFWFIRRNNELISLKITCTEKFMVEYVYQSAFLVP